MKEYYIVTFENTHQAINAENQSKNHDINIEIMPTPTYITKSCGISLRVDLDEINKIKTLVREDKIKIKDIYLRKSDRLVQEYMD